MTRPAPFPPAGARYPSRGRAPPLEESMEATVLGGVIAAALAAYAAIVIRKELTK